MPGQPENQGVNAELTGNMPASPAGYDYPPLAEHLPARTCSQLFQESVDAAAPRTVTPYWSDISGALQSTWHPPASVNQDTPPELRRLHRGGPGRKEIAVSTTTCNAQRRRRSHQGCARSDRSQAENRLGLQARRTRRLVMLLVTAWPMIQALYLSLFRYRLTAPDDKEFVGLSNYGTVLTDSCSGRTRWNTVLIMVVTVAVELVIGFAFAMVMHRIIFARGVMRTSILIPYGIITVVSAFAWQFAFSTQQRLRQRLVLLAAVDRRGHQLVRRPLAGDVRDHGLRDLEDHAVHGAAAARRPLPGLARTCSRRPRSTAPPGGSGCAR